MWPTQPRVSVSGNSCAAERHVNPTSCARPGYSVRRSRSRMSNDSRSQGLRICRWEGVSLSRQSRFTVFHTSGAAGYFIPCAWLCTWDKGAESRRFLLDIRTGVLHCWIQCSVGKRSSKVMRVSTFYPVSGYRGRIGKSPMVYFMRGSDCFARAYVRPRDPKSARQVESRARMAELSRAWSTLSAARRLEWESYGRRWFPGQRSHGQNTFIKVSAFRPETHNEAPLQPPPPAITGATEEVSGAPDAFAFRIIHPVKDCTAWRVLVRTTPASPTLARAPRERDFRWVCGHGVASLAQLPASGGVLRISGALQPVPAGARYGVRLRLVSPEGVPGPEIALDLIRQTGNATRTAAEYRSVPSPRVSLYFTPAKHAMLVAKDYASVGPVRALRRSKKRKRDAHVRHG